MSYRSGYTDDYCEDNWAHIRWRGAVNSAIRGERGQSLLRQLATALDALPLKELVADEFAADGCFCALGAVGAMRGMDLSRLDPEDRRGVAEAFGVAEALAAEIMDINDMHAYYDHSATDAAGLAARERLDRQRRWTRVRKWVGEHLKEEQAAAAAKLTAMPWRSKP